MFAIVCDCCGKTTLLASRDDHEHRYKLLNEKSATYLDLCEECAGRLVQAAREQRGHECR